MGFHEDLMAGRLGAINNSDPNKPSLPIFPIKDAGGTLEALSSNGIAGTSIPSLFGGKKKQGILAKFHESLQEGFKNASQGSGGGSGIQISEASSGDVWAPWTARISSGSNSSGMEI